MAERGLFVGSFDPIHNGHLDIIIKASFLCKELLVAVLPSDHKADTCFSFSEREIMLKQAINQLNLKNVSVLTNTEHQLLTEIYILNDCDLLIRGIRNKQDEIYELHSIKNHKMIFPKSHIMSKQFNYKLISSRDCLSGLSSSFLKSVISKNIYVNSGKIFDQKLDISNGIFPYRAEMEHYHFNLNPALVPVCIKRKLEERILGQYKIAITGQMGVGKSYIAEQLAQFIQTNYGYISQVIKFDNLIREIYDDDNLGSQNLRNELWTYYGPGKISDEDVLSPDKKKVIRSALAKKMFYRYSEHHKQEMQDYYRHYIQEQMLPLFLVKYRQKLNELPKINMEKIVIIEWAQLAEMDMGNWTNHNAIMVDSSDRDKLLSARGLSMSSIKERSQYQLSSDDKIKRLTEAAEKNAAEANIIKFNNTIENGKANVKQLADHIIHNVFNLT